MKATEDLCGFSERYPQFTEKGAVVLGVSKDSVASHKKFVEKYGLVFTLLADPERTVIETYDVWKEKKNYGKVSMGVVRTTYLILICGGIGGGAQMALAEAGIELCAGQREMWIKQFQVILLVHL